MMIGRKLERIHLRQLWFAAMPALFVFLWSTGYMGAKLGLEDSGPLTFLFVRFLVVALLLAIAAFLWRAPWPKTWTEMAHLAVAGLLMQVIFLGGLFISIARGVDTGVAALIVGIQPLLVAAGAGLFLGERIGSRQWAGLVLGLVGVGLVVGDKLNLGAGAPLDYAWSFGALVGISAGTLYQKSFCARVDLRTGNTVQFAASALLVLPPAYLLESLAIVWSGRFLFALLWLCVVLSLGALSILYILIRHGAAAKVASLFYLVPPVAALIGFVLFDERLSLLALSGLGVASLGVALVNIRAERI
jgi:drug/metabolite transporter (DMT)-like permease